MDLHEFQAKIILKKYGIQVPDFAVFSTVNECEKILSNLKLKEAVLKVQVLAGGRGKAGGVKLARSVPEILAEAKNLIGLRIINNQTGKEGVVAKKVLITPIIDYVNEFYVGAVIDRDKAEGVLILSREGGVNIEETAEKHPEKVLKWGIPLNGKLSDKDLKMMTDFMKFTGKQETQGKEIITSLVKAFIETDAMLIEINPLVETKEGDLVALDAKLTVDDNALFRQKEIEKFYDETEMNPNDALAKKYDLAYVALDGNIGCMVNGAGLAMATMDIISIAGGKAANFLDVGGSATAEKVAEGFKIILSDPNVKAILVNIFGGIMNCETLASGIIKAADVVHLHVPLVVRMEGTNVEKGKKLLADSKLDIIIANDLNDAAKKVVEKGVLNVHPH